MNQVTEITRVSVLYKKAVGISVKSLTEILYKETNGNTTFSLLFVKNDLPKLRLYKQWREYYDSIIDDCVKIYKMERWIAESVFGIDLNKFVEKQFKIYWGKIAKHKR